MKIVKLSSRGQILIPKIMRDELHLPQRTEFVICVTGVGFSLVPKTLFPEAKSDEVRGVLAKKGRNMPDDDVMKARIKMRLNAQDDASKG